MLVENEGALLLVQRKRPPFRDFWTLPGDLVGEGESAEDTLSRVAEDHLGVRLQGQELVDTLTIADGGVEYDASVYRIGFEGRPRYRESGPYAEIGWAEPGELEQLDITLPQALRDLIGRMAEGG